ncbi:serine hydrolase domain-containing protein [Archangium primigenium]|uniref:serine hydrolase domain-containing protein n=1 Tax=[Archangium] primigenium TaxID=2792470 RepID=UPI00195CB17B|nr:serine hydrolase [Archangium primigenium]MBM7119380.1 serine hydrolase [Archangium primigenium]
MFLSRGRRALALLALVAPLAAGAEEWPGTDWPRGEIAAPAEALRAFEAYAFPPRDDAQSKGVRTDSVVVIVDGHLVYERYAGENRPETPHLTWSISKSVMATVLGVAFREGHFQPDDAVARHYPPFARHPDIHLRHLLHWASGLDWSEGYEASPLKSSVIAMLYTRGRDDMAVYTASRPAVVPPGTRHVYSSGDSNVLSASLKSMVGEAYADYPWTAVFEPLGITSAVWERDASGTYVGSSYAYMTARDLARVGLLMARGGRWKDQQFLPPAWMEVSLTPFAHYVPDPRAPVAEAIPGGHWWLNRAFKGAPRPWKDAPEDTLAALGHWGQGLFVIPSEKMVIVRFADDRDRSFRQNEFLARARAAFLPAGGGQ